MPRARASGVGLRTDNGENSENPDECKFLKNMMMQCTWLHDKMQHASKRHGDDSE